MPPVITFLKRNNLARRHLNHNRAPEVGNRRDNTLDFYIDHIARICLEGINRPAEFIKRHRGKIRRLVLGKDADLQGQNNRQGRQRYRGKFSHIIFPSLVTDSVHGLSGWQHTKNPNKVNQNKIFS
ncbi:MAG: hypothetical protein AB1599_04130 [Planctomycetota bacterium]